MEKSLSLYQLTAEQQAIEDALIENDGELTPELEEMLNANTEALATKVDGYNMILRKFAGAELMIDNEMKILAAKKKSAQNAQKNLKNHILWAMQNAGLDKIEGNLCKASIRKSQSLDVDETELLSQYEDTINTLKKYLPTYCSVEIKVNKTAIKDVYKTCGVLPAGCMMIENESVTIK